MPESGYKIRFGKDAPTRRTRKSNLARVTRLVLIRAT